MYFSVHKTMKSCLTFTVRHNISGMNLYFPAESGQLEVQ